MKKTKILAWAQAKSILGFDQIEVTYDAKETPRQILQRLEVDLSRIGSFRIAVNHEISGWDRPVGEMEEMAVIPPVSGG